MRTGMLGFALAKALLLLAPACHAAAASDLGSRVASWQLAPGFHGIGVRVFVRGDADSNATVQLFAREHGSGAPYDSATTCFRRYGGGFDGVVIWCAAGRTYDVRARLTDPDGGSTTLDTTVATRVASTRVTGPLVYVAPPGSGGADTNPGTPARPKATIPAALAALFALPDEGRGGGVVLRPGLYPGDVTIQSGHATGDTLYHLMGDGTAPDSTILDGSDAQSFAWQPYHRAQRDSLYFATARLGPCANVFRGWGRRLHRFESLHALASDSTGLAEGYFVARGTAGAEDTLLVKTLDGLAPAISEVFHVGERAQGVWIQRPYWHVSNLAIRFQGGEYGNGIGVRLGGGSEQTRGSGCVLDSLHVYGTGTHAIYGEDAGAPSWCDSVLVRDCRLEGRGIERWPYSTCKNGNCESCGILAPGCAWGVFGTDVSGYFDGIDLDDFTGGGRTFISTDSTGASDAEVMFNHVHDVADDGAELDGSAGINRRYIANTLRDTNFGMSLAPVTLGPNWIVGNTIVRARQGGLKIGSIHMLGSGRVALYHNTLAGTPGRFFVPMYHIAQGFRRLRSRNNVFVAAGRGAYVFRDLDNEADAAGRTSSDFDYDVMDTTAATGIWAWRSSEYSLARLRADLGFEAHGRVGHVDFIDTGPGAFGHRLRAASLASGAGQRIPGIDTPMFGVRHFTGTAPDAGAWPVETPGPRR